MSANTADDPPPEVITLPELNDRIKSELTAIENRRQEIIDQGAREGKTISTAPSLQRLRELQASLTGPNKDAEVREIEETIREFQQRWGCEIPVDEAYRFVKEHGGFDSQTPESERAASALRTLIDLCGDRRLPRSDMRNLLEEFPANRNLDPEFVVSLAKFAAIQYGRWQTEYLFSPVALPDTLAADEAKGWLEIWRIYASAISDAAPNARAYLATLPRQSLVDPATKKGSALWGTALLKTAIVARVGKILERLGFKSLGSEIFRRGVFPPGTVGRQIGLDG